MSWDRAAAAKALAAELAAVLADVGDPATVYDRPPGTINPPAVVVGRPTEVRFSVIAPGIDEVLLPVLCVGPLDGDDRVADLIAAVRLIDNTNLDGVVQIAYPTTERNWRQVNVAGADLLSAEVTFTVQM